MKHDSFLPFPRRELDCGGFYARIGNAKPNQIAFKFGAVESCCGRTQCLSESVHLRRNMVVSDKLGHSVSSGVEMGGEGYPQPAWSDNGD